MGGFKPRVILGDCECGTFVQCSPDEVLMIWTNWNAATVTATCKNCGRVVKHETVFPETRQSLSMAGVTETYPPSPGEEYPGGPPIDHDDVLVFHNKLNLGDPIWDGNDLRRAEVSRKSSSPTRRIVSTLRRGSRNRRRSARTAW